jgi:GTP 3',8-cyclase
VIRLPHLETDITQACQLSCVACNHHVPLYRAAGPRQTTAAQVERDLGHLATIMHADLWGALGGEPLLHRGLVDILGVVRASGIADRLEVWTNGLLLRRQGPEFWRAFDILVLSVYEGKLTDDDLLWIRARCADENVVLDLKDERSWHNFRTLFEPEATNEEGTRVKFHACSFRTYSRVANEGWFFTCCCAPHMPVLLQGRPFGTDGVKIEGLTKEGLRLYLEREEPLSVCSICAGRATALPIPWHEERDPVRWLAESGRRGEE